MDHLILNMTINEIEVALILILFKYNVKHTDMNVLTPSEMYNQIKSLNLKKF